MFYRHIIPPLLFFMWNNKRPSSFTVNKLRGEIKDVSFPLILLSWFSFYYHCSSMQLIFESVCKLCTQVVHFSIQSLINNSFVNNILEIWHIIVLESKLFFHIEICVCVYMYLHTVPQRHVQKSIDTHVW